jgi:hypothetical protein
LGVDSSCYWPVGIKDIINNDVYKIYPNPNTGSFIIELYQQLIGQNIYVLDITGKLLLTQPAKQKNYIHLQNFARGIYFVKVGNIVKRIVIE